MGKLLSRGTEKKIPTKEQILRTLKNAMTLRDDVSDTTEDYQNNDQNR